MATKNLYPISVDGKHYDLPMFCNMMIVASPPTGAIFVHYENGVPIGVSLTDKKFLQQLQGALNVMIQNLP